MPEESLEAKIARLDEQNREGAGFHKWTRREIEALKTGDAAQVTHTALVVVELGHVKEEVGHLREDFRALTAVARDNTTKLDALLRNGFNGKPRRRTQAAVASGGVGLIVTVAAAWAKIIGWV